MDNRVSVLRAARDLLAAGWCQGSLRWAEKDGDVPSYCAVGAVLKVATKKGFAEAATAVYPFLSVVKGCLPDDGYRVGSIDTWTAIVRYNNDRGRTQAEILDLFDRAIASLQPAKDVIDRAKDTDLITTEINEEITA